MFVHLSALLGHRKNFDTVFFSEILCLLDFVVTGRRVSCMGNIVCIFSTLVPFGNRKIFTFQDASFRGSPYMLRPRRAKLTHAPSPATQVESPHSFAKTVRQLERIAEKNSRMVCAVVTAKNSK